MGGCCCTAGCNEQATSIGMHVDIKCHMATQRVAVKDRARGGGLGSTCKQTSVKLWIQLVAGAIRLSKTLVVR
jgi:hypothetical protein